jgi:hypothetical protein
VSLPPDVNWATRRTTNKNFCERNITRYLKYRSGIRPDQNFFQSSTTA